MKLEIALKRLVQLFVLKVLLNFINISRPIIPSTEACLPRINIMFPRFAKKAYNWDETENSFDKQAEKRAYWTTSDWIEKHKYPLEQHTVTTKDGYQLKIQRLPKPKQRAVILVHGLLTSSLAWVLMGPEKSLAFLLYDRNYDVWLANLRGTAYARSHTKLNVSSVDFWNFSFHEEGIYDLPAIIDYVRNKSPFHQVLLIGHSQVNISLDPPLIEKFETNLQAFNAFLVMCSLLPEYNERVLFMQALAPLSKLKGAVKFKTEDAKLVMKFVKKKRKSQKYEIFEPGELKSKCLKRNSGERRECLRIYENFVGNGQHSRTLDPIVFGSLLQGGSVREVTHLYQIWQSGDFVSYDYGLLENLRFYNAVNPNTYNLERITVPMILHFGETDAIATPNGVHSIYSRLINSEFIYGVYRVSAAKFNHFDFLISNEVKTLVNDKLIEIMENYFAGKLKYVIE